LPPKSFCRSPIHFQLQWVETVGELALLVVFADGFARQRADGGQHDGIERRKFHSITCLLERTARQGCVGVGGSTKPAQRSKRIGGQRPGRRIDCFTRPAGTE